jgi:hypothetical protein
VDGTDQPLRFPVVAKQLPRAFDPAGNGAVADGPAGPDCLDELILGDQAIPIFNEEEEQGQDLGFDGHHATMLAQLKLAQIQDMIRDPVPHCMEQ